MLKTVWYLYLHPYNAGLPRGELRTSTVDGCCQVKCVHELFMILCRGRRQLFALPTLRAKRHHNRKRLLCVLCPSCPRRKIAYSTESSPDAVHLGQEELRKLENKGKELEAKIFELQCMRGKGLTAAQAAGIVPRDRDRDETEPETVPSLGAPPEAK